MLVGCKMVAKGLEKRVPAGEMHFLPPSRIILELFLGLFVHHELQAAISLLQY